MQLSVWFDNFCMFKTCRFWLTYTKVQHFFPRMFTVVEKSWLHVKSTEPKLVKMVKLAARVEFDSDFIIKLK